MKLKLYNEFEISKKQTSELNELLTASFPDIDYKKRDYFKQLPHYRILAEENEKIIGQVGIDFRAMNLNDIPVHVFGVIDLCVHPEFQGNGTGKMLMEEVNRIACKYPDKIDFLLLITDTPEYYKKLGYSITELHAIWLKLENHQNYGVGIEKLNDAFIMLKPVTGKEIKTGALDFLGYMY